MGLSRAAPQSLYYQCPLLVGQIDESLRPFMQLFPFSGDCFWRLLRRPLTGRPAVLYCAFWSQKRSTIGVASRCYGHRIIVAPVSYTHLTLPTNREV